MSSNQYVATRAFPTTHRQYEMGDMIDTSRVTSGELNAGVASGAVLPARFTDTAAKLAALNPVLGPGVVAYEIDTGVMKIGTTGAVAYNSLPQVGTATYLSVFKPEAYGAATAYSASVDDTTFVQAAIDAAIAAGGIVWLSRVYRIPSGGLTASGFLHMRGIGGRFLSANQGGTFPGLAPSGFRCATTTGTCLTTSAAGCILEDFAVINAPGSDATSGVGIQINDGHNYALNRVTVQNFWNNLQVEGRFGTIDSCHVYDPVNYGIYFLSDSAGLGDFGDQGVTNSVVAMLGRTTTAAAAVRWESGGGMRWGNNKIVAGTGPGASGIGSFSYGLDLRVTDGVSTVEWMVGGGGISTCSTACVLVDTLGPSNTGFFGDVTFEGVVFQGGGGSAVGMILGTTALSNNIIKRISVNGCTFKGVVAGGILIRNAKGIHIGTNVWDPAAYTGPLITIASAPDGVRTADISIARQNLTGNTNGVDVVLDQRRLTSVAHTLSGKIDHGWDTQMFANTVGTWVTAGYVDLPTADGGAAEIELILTGYDFGVGPMYARYRRILTKSQGSGTVTVATDGTDTTAGAGSHYAVQFVTTTANRVIVQYQLTTSGTTIWGRQRVEVHGDVARLHVGP